MTIFLILGAVAAFYLLWLLFRLAALALPIYAGISLGLFMHASGYGYAASITSGLAAGTALLLVARLLIAFSPLLRWPTLCLFIVPAAFAGYQTAAGLAGQAMEPGIWLGALSWIGALVAATGAWNGLAGKAADGPASRPHPQAQTEIRGRGALNPSNSHASTSPVWRVQAALPPVVVQPICRSKSVPRAQRRRGLSRCAIWQQAADAGPARNGAAGTFFPRRSAVPRATRNSRPRRPPLCSGPMGAGPHPCRLSIRIEAAIVAVFDQGKDKIMSKIGSFKKVSGEYKGQIITLAVQAKSVRIAPVEKPGQNGPSHRVFVGEVEVGAAWSKKTQDDRPYLSVKLDDPSFTAPVFAQLFEGDEGQYDLVWNRPARRSDG